MPPKNMATPNSGKKLAADPNAGCSAMSTTGKPIIPMTTAKLRTSR